MADLTKKTRFCWITIRKHEQDYPLDFEKRLKDYCEENCKTYAFICHDHDLDLKSMTIERHYHLYGEFKKNQRLSTRLNGLVLLGGFANPFGIQIERAMSPVRCIQYLIHKKQPEKTQHSIDEIISNIDRDELQCILDTDNDSDDICTFDFIIQCLYQEKTIADVIQKLGLHNYKNYRNVIWDLIKTSQHLKAKYNV